MAFRVKRASTLTELSEILAACPDAYMVAGGTDIIPRENQGIEHHCTYVCIDKIPELQGIERLPDGSVSIGAAVKLADIVELPQLADFAALRRACSKIATPQIRNQGTIGGNVLQENRCVYFNQSVSWRRIDLCYKLGGNRCYQYKGSDKCVALFQSDAAPVLISYGTRALLVGSKGCRSVPLSSIYLDAGRKAKGADEILMRLVIPPFAGRLLSAYERETIRNSFDFPLVSCALALTEEMGMVIGASMVMGSAGVKPGIVHEAEKLLCGRKVSDVGGSLEELKKCGERAVMPFRDIRVDAVTRKAFAGALVERVVKNIIGS